MKKKKNKKWMKFRHKVVRVLAGWALFSVCKIKYGIKVTRFRKQGKRPYLILFNHQTPFDQFFVGLAFKGPVYYLATEDIFSNGFVSSLIRWLVAPIPIKKQVTDGRAVMNCLRVAREGGTIALAPEGNRTYSGKTEYMNPAIAALARKLALPIALYRIEGGFGTEPRFSDRTRKGSMRSYVSRVIEPEEYKEMSDSELFAIIEKELFVNDYDLGGTWRGNHRAEYIERALYICPFCSLSEFESHGNSAHCKNCGFTFEYNEDLTLKSDRADFKFKNFGEWYDWQKDFINNFDPFADTATPLFSDVVDVYEVVLQKKKVLLKSDDSLLLYGDKITLLGEELPFTKIQNMAVLGRNKLNIYSGDTVYQIKGGKRFNALKFVHIFNRHKNVLSDEKNVTFLGM